MAATATLVVVAHPATLIGVTVNTGAASAVLTVYDNASAGSGTKLATIDCSATGSFSYGARTDNGITVVLSGGNADVTIIHG